MIQKKKIFFFSGFTKELLESFFAFVAVRLSNIYILVVAHGSHNVSRWMTWLPISLKNAAKCDKWYQLQNHLITESLNAKGAWEKLLVSDPQACRIAQCRTKTQ